jgi:hypothetical protein
MADSHYHLSLNFRTMGSCIKKALQGHVLLVAHTRLQYPYFFLLILSLSSNICLSFSSRTINI